MKSVLSSPRLPTAAFSLIELLSVLAILCVLSSLAAPALSSVLRGGDANRAVAGVSGILDLAREYAVSKNTYTWVVLAADTASPSGAKLYAVILGSQDGSNTCDGTAPVDLDQPGSYDLASNSANIGVLRKALAFSNTVIGSLSASPAPASLQPAAPNSKISFRLPPSPAESVSYLNNNPAAQRVIQFSPNGQARISGSLAQVIELGVKPMKGADTDEINAAAIHVSGLTGQTQVFRR